MKAHPVGKHLHSLIKLIKIHTVFNTAATQVHTQTISTFLKSKILTPNQKGIAHFFGQLFFKIAQINHVVVTVRKCLSSTISHASAVLLWIFAKNSVERATKSFRKASEIFSLQKSKPSLNAEVKMFIRVMIADKRNAKLMRQVKTTT